MDRMMAEDPYAHIDFTAWTYQQHVSIAYYQGTYIYSQSMSHDVYFEW